MRLKARLAAEGLFDHAAKRLLPALPRCIGVVTSMQAAALRDVLTCLARRAPYASVIVYPVPVQGAGAGQRIAAMLQVVSVRAEVDVVLLVRGGGSIEDLWAFNEEAVARAIRASRLPVVVGIGHESDITIADFAADVRAATPTAAAELAAPSRDALLAEVDSRLQPLKRGLVAPPASGVAASGLCPARDRHPARSAGGARCPIGGPARPCPVGVRSRRPGIGGCASAAGARKCCGCGRSRPARFPRKAFARLASLTVEQAARGRDPLGRARSAPWRARPPRCPAAWLCDGA